MNQKREKREKHTWRSDTFIDTVILLIVSLLHGYFLRLLPFTNGTKSRKVSQMVHT